MCAYMQYKGSVCLLIFLRFRVPQSRSLLCGIDSAEKSLHFSMLLICLTPLV